MGLIVRQRRSRSIRIGLASHSNFVRCGGGGSPPSRSIIVLLVPALWRVWNFAYFEFNRRFFRETFLAGRKCFAFFSLLHATTAGRKWNPNDIDVLDRPIFLTKETPGPPKWLFFGKTKKNKTFSNAPAGVPARMCVCVCVGNEEKRVEDRKLWNFRINQSRRYCTAHGIDIVAGAGEFFGTGL